jgi:hypothetical protein
MSLYDYEVGKEIWAKYSDDEFYGIVQTLMRFADSTNLAKLKTAWPDIWTELQSRYNAPGGLLPGETLEKGCEGVSTERLLYLLLFRSPSEVIVLPMTRKKN